MRLFAAGLGLLLFACSSAPIRRDPALDPSSPDAKEGRPLEAPTALGTPAAAAPAPAPANEAPTTYVCPMHPEVTSQAPGKCPKCGMSLVPQKPAAPEETHHHHAPEGGHP